MSKGKKGQSRALARMETKSAQLAGLRYVGGDPISIGPSDAINIDLTKLAAPSNVYDADFAWIRHRPGSLSLFFAKRSLVKDNELRTRLELRYPPENFVHQFWKFSEEFYGKLQKFIDRWPKDEERDKQDPTLWAADKDHSEWANFEAISHAGTEATLDFYLLPPSGVAYFKQGRGSSALTIIPIVRVQLTTFELGRLFSSAATVVEEIKAYLPKPAIEELEQERSL